MEYAGSTQNAAAKTSRWMQVGFSLCLVIAAVVATRRLIILSGPIPQGTTPAAKLDAFFASHTGLMVAHLVPALLFVLLVPAFYSRRFRGDAWIAGALYAVGAVIGLTAYVMTFHLVGGLVEAAAIVTFNSLFLYSLLRSFRWMWHRDRSLQQTWMTAAIGILLGIATMRPIMGAFFATSKLSHLQPDRFFGPAFWIGFCVNTLVVEVWLRRRQQSLFSLRHSQEASTV